MSIDIHTHFYNIYRNFHINLNIDRMDDPKNVKLKILGLLNPYVYILSLFIYAMIFWGVFILNIHILKLVKYIRRISLHEKNPQINAAFPYLKGKVLN